MEWKEEYVSLPSTRQETAFYNPPPHKHKVFIFLFNLMKRFFFLISVTEQKEEATGAELGPRPEGIAVSTGV